MVGTVENIVNCIKQNESFILDAGAGSGKTWSLVQALNYAIKTKSKSLLSRNQKIICITYTNVAKNEIIERTEHNVLIQVSTIHDFLWDCIRNFQTELRCELLEIVRERLTVENERMAAYTSRAIKSKEKSEKKIAKYNEALESIRISSPRIIYDNYPSYKKGKFSHDDLIDISERIFRKYPLIRKIVTDTYPIIFVDEYQDTQSETIKILLEYLRGAQGFLLGFFGDKQQQIYDEGAGEIPGSYGLKSIKKTENFRSSIEVIELLNRLRADIQQYQPPENIKRGEALFFYSPSVTSFNAIDFIEQNLKARWKLNSNSEVKVLYLTHRFIAKENGYEDLYQLHSGRAEIITKNQDNRGWSPYTDFLFDIEEIVNLFMNKQIQLFLRKISYEVISFESRNNLAKIMDGLIGMRKTNTIGKVVEYVIENKILQASENMENYNLDDPEDLEEKEFYQKLMELPYSQFIRLYQIQQNNTPFSTKHGTKGDEFNNVLVVIDDDSWKQKYNFNEYFSDENINPERENRTRNLFYVVCSRAKYNLAIVGASPFVPKAIANIKALFGNQQFIQV